jgi:hypothetical protein
MAALDRTRLIGRLPLLSPNPKKRRAILRRTLRFRPGGTAARSSRGRPGTRRKSGPSGSAAHIPVRRRSRNDPSTSTPQCRRDLRCTWCERRVFDVASRIASRSGGSSAGMSASRDARHLLGTGQSEPNLMHISKLRARSAASACQPGATAAVISCGPRSRDCSNGWPARVRRPWSGLRWS